MNTHLYLAFLSLFSTQAFATQAYFCGTTNQWPLNSHSGWFLQLDLDKHVAYVTKALNATTLRRYSYQITPLEGSQLVLTSEYGDKIVMSTPERAGITYTAHYEHTSHLSTGNTRRGDPQEDFEFSCFPTSAVNPVEFNALMLDKNLFIYKLTKNLHDGTRKYFYELPSLEQRIPFPLLAQVLQRHTLSQIGDWEDTILNPSQVEKVFQTLLSQDKGFAELARNIESDAKNSTLLSYRGLLFARDWYSRVGKVAFVLQYENKLIVIPHDFDSRIRFGDARLDYVF